MSTLSKMVPQVMLFQKIVSNLGALFSMQTPLGSRTTPRNAFPVDGFASNLVLG